jgi:hypothetical protein
MTEYQLKRRAVLNFKNYWVEKNVKREYQRQWLRSVSLLGAKWRLAIPIGRLATPRD